MRKFLIVIVVLAAGAIIVSAWFFHTTPFLMNGVKTFKGAEYKDDPQNVLTSVYPDFPNFLKQQGATINDLPHNIIDCHDDEQCFSARKIDLTKSCTPTLLILKRLYIMGGDEEAFVPLGTQDGECAVISASYNSKASSPEGSSSCLYEMKNGNLDTCNDPRIFDPPFPLATTIYNTSNWTTCSNTVYHYQFRYPSTWQLFNGTLDNKQQAAVAVTCKAASARPWIWIKAPETETILANGSVNIELFSASIITKAYHDIDAYLKDHDVTPLQTGENFQSFFVADPDSSAAIVVIKRPEQSLVLSSFNNNGSGKGELLFFLKQMSFQ